MANDNENGSNGNGNDTPVVVQVVNTLSRQQWSQMVETALHREAVEGRIRHYTVFAANAEDASKLVRRLSADAVIAPRKYREGLKKRIKPELPIIDLDSRPDWLGDEKDRLSAKWSDTGGKQAWFNNKGEYGTFGMEGFKGADRFGWTDMHKTLGGFKRMVGGEIVALKPFLGGRVAGGIDGPMAGPFADLVKWLIDFAISDIQQKYNDYKQAKETLDRIEKQLNDLNKKNEEKQKQKKEPGKGGGSGGQSREPDDTGGGDFLLMMKEIIEEAQIDEFWRAMVEHRLKPSQTDRRDEVLHWLRERDLLGEETMRRVLAGMPLPEEDETLFAMQYWLWSHFSGKRTSSKFLDYLIRKGAPIDPKFGSSKQAGKVFHMVGDYDGPEHRLRLQFQG